MKKIKDQFKNEFQSLTLEGDSFYIDDAAERPLGLIPYGEPVQEVIEEEVGVTVEGESVVVSGGNPEKEVKATVNGNSYQETTEGYQLFNKDEVVRNKYINNLGEILESNYFSISSPIPVISGGNITYKGLTDVGTTVYSNFYNENDEVVETFKQEVGVNTKSVPSNATYVIFSIRMRVENSFNEDKETFQVINGTEDKPYEPYTNGASPNTEYKQDIEVIEAYNILNPANLSLFNANKYIQTKTRIEVEANTEYSIVSNKAFTDMGINGFSDDTNYEKLTATTVIKNNKRYYTFTTNADTKTIHFYAGQDTEYTTIEEFIKLLEMMLIEGTSDKPYLPYGHIGLVQRGKNRLKFKETTTQTSSGLTGTANVDGSFKLNGTTTGTVAMGFNLEPYKVKGTHRASGYTKDGLAQLYWKDKNGTVKYKEIRETTPINFEEGDTLFQIFCWTNVTGKTYNNETFYLQLEEGSEATPFEPPIEPIVHSIDLAGEKLAKVGEIADLLNIGVDGRVSIEKKTVLDISNNSENWISVKPSIGVFIKNVQGISKNSNIVSNIYQKVYDQVWETMENGKCFALNNQILIKDNRFSSLADLSNQYSQTPLQLLYPTTKSQTITLPSIEPITLFEGTNVFELVTNLGTTMAVTYNYVTPSPSIDRPSEILTVKGSYDTELKNEDASIINKLPLTLTKELLGEIVTLTEEEAKQLNLDGAGKYRRTDYGRSILDGVNKKFIAKSGTTFNNLFFTNAFDLNVLTPAANYEVIKHYSNYFKGEYSVDSLYARDLQGSAIRNDKVFGMGFGLNSSINTLEKANQFLMENPVEFIYPLKPPTYEKITDETELAQLSAYDKQIAFFGINNINTYPTDNLEKAPLKLKVTYDKSNRIALQE